MTTRGVKSVVGRLRGLDRNKLVVYRPLVASKEEEMLKVTISGINPGDATYDAT